MFSRSVILYLIKSFLLTRSELNSKNAEKPPVLGSHHWRCWSTVMTGFGFVKELLFLLASKLSQYSSIQSPHANAGDNVFCFLFSSASWAGT